MVCIGDTPTLLADVDKAGVDSLVKLLKRLVRGGAQQAVWKTLACYSAEHVCIARYKLRAKVDVADVSSEYAVWARFGPGQFAEGQIYYLMGHYGAAVLGFCFTHLQPMSQCNYSVFRDTCKL